MSRVALTVLIVVPFINFDASYHIGFDPVGLESTISFTEANFSLSLDQGKYLASSLNRILLYNINIMP
jgi:hypothetical protein